MSSSDRLSILTNTISELVGIAGKAENTKIFPNALVIDAAPVGLPVGYITVKNEEGFYIPAVKVAGLLVSAGDHVNILYIKGTEPIAFQQGSLGVPPGYGWPFAHVLTVDPTDPDADYATIGAAIGAAIDGDCILIGAGNYAEELTIDNQALTLIGLGQVVITDTAAGPAIFIDPFGPSGKYVYLENLTVIHTGAYVGVEAAQIWSLGRATNCKFIVVGIAPTTDAIGINVYSDFDLYNCEISATGGSVINVAANIQANSNISGGIYNGATADINVGGLANIINPVLVRSLLTGAGIITGRYLDAYNNICFVPIPNPGTFLEGKFYYDEIWKSLAIEGGYNSKLIVGQDTFRLVWNGTGAPLLKGTVVYVSGAYTAGTNNVISVAKADATDAAKSIVLGLVNEDIADASYGFVIISGYLFPIKTDYTAPPDPTTWAAGDNLYLSDTTPGELINTEPTTGNFKVLVGRIATIGGVAVGKIHVHSATQFKLGGLLDVVTTAPTLDEVLRWNGVEWVNGAPVSSSASVGISFFMDDVNILPINAENLYQVNILSKTPITTAEVLDTISCTSGSSPVQGEAYLYNVALGRTAIDGGVWNFNTYCGVNLATGITQMLRSLFIVEVSTGTVTITGGPGTSRTATSTVDAFVTGALGDARADLSMSGHVQTPKGFYSITAVATTKICTIEVPAAYVNEAAVSFSKWRYLFQASTGEINEATPNLGLHSVQTAQSSFVIAATDKLGEITFGSTNTIPVKTITFSHNGTLHYSHFTTPLITLHNNLAGIQGGSANEAYHLFAPVRGSIPIANATPSWVAYNAKTNHFILVGDGNDVTSKAFDWDDVGLGAGADMVHSHASAAEGGVFDGLTITPATVATGLLVNGTTTGANQRGISITASMNDTGGTNIGVFSSPTQTSISAGFYGLYGSPRFAATAGGPQAVVYGLLGIPQITTAGSQNVTSLFGGFFRLDNNSTAGAVVTNAYTLFVASPIATGAITNAYGIYIDSFTVGGTLNYAIFVAGGMSRLCGVTIAADNGGLASTVGLSNVTSGVAAGIGTVLMNGATARDSTGWWKIYDGTSARYVPFWTTITG